MSPENAIEILRKLTGSSSDFSELIGPRRRDLLTQKGRLRDSQLRMHIR